MATIDQELVMAAGTLRRRIEQMPSPDVDGEWHTGVGVNHEAMSVTVVSEGVAHQVADTASMPTATYIATMHPAVGMVVAKAMARAARHWNDGYPCCSDGPDFCREIVGPALEIARLVNRAKR
jgi:hypothetical protein